MSNPSDQSSSDAPVAWFQNPNVPGNGPTPESTVYINQAAQPQSGQGPEGAAWTPQETSSTGPSTQEAGQSALSNLFPSQHPQAPVFNPKK
ncbi:hypothetical protein BDV93DRAFT_524496 [Ceratobasidium sp. AG-I]|nr:hypothetical protein BDV93DRAFT_524496 [Ceratobasidium sp. AG-I]